MAKELLHEAGLKTGNLVHVSVSDNTIVIRKAGKKYPTLAELVAKIPKSYKHQHKDMFGKPVGREVW